MTGLAIFADEEDIEGLRFVYDDGTILDVRANHDVASPVQQLSGYPVGFRVTFGTNTEDTANMPMSIQAYYNSCMCPVSVFEHQGDL